MFISCTSCHRWRIWVFVLQSCLLPDAGIVVISITGVILISISFLIKDNIQGLSCEESFRFIHMHPKIFSMIRVSKEEVGGKRTPVCPLKTLPCSHLHGCIINLSGLEKINQVVKAPPRITGPELWLIARVNCSNNLMLKAISYYIL